MDDKYDEIISFAELEEFQDRIFKQLSSGMKSRLAFSIACLVNPDILILDEVLSVGDGAFRKKSAEKMKSILNSGVTGILVSHSMVQVRELCNKILWLDRGRQIAFTNDVSMCCNAYEEFLIRKKVPESESEVKKLSQAWIARKEKQKQKQNLTEIQKLEAMIRSVNEKQAMETAVKFLKEKNPALLK